MRKFVVGLILLALTLAQLGGCASNQLPTEKPKDFSIILNYGVGAKNVLNTKDETFTKDLILAGNKTTHLKLTNDELENVYKDMQKIGIMDYPEVFKPENFVSTRRVITPHPTYQFTIEYAGKQKRVLWDDESLAEGLKAKQLRDLINMLVSIIESKDEFKQLPKAQGGYM